MKTKLMIWIIIFSILTCLQGCKDIDKYKYDFIKNSITNPDDFDNILDKVPFKKDLFLKDYYQNDTSRKSIKRLLRKANYLLLKEGYTILDLGPNKIYEDYLNLDKYEIIHEISLHSKHFESFYINFIWKSINDEWIFSGITTQMIELN